MIFRRKNKKTVVDEDIQRRIVETRKLTKNAKESLKEFNEVLDDLERALVRKSAGMATDD